MDIEFLGAAQTVTGSMHLLRDRARDRAARLRPLPGQAARSRSSRTSTSPSTPARVDAVVLSHAHIDHSGALPMLVKNGYDGPIYATPATRDLCAVMLRDAAAIQERRRPLPQPAGREGRIAAPPVEPLYADEDVIETIAPLLLRPVPPHRCPSPTACGSPSSTRGTCSAAPSPCSTSRRARQDQAHRLHRRPRPLRSPHPPRPGGGRGRDVLITESTYGDRLHDGTDKMDEDLARVVRRTHERGGKLLIPSFALERAQEVIFALKKLRQKERIPRVKVYVDSPLTVKITDVFKLHPECYDAETRALIRGHDSPFDFPDLRYVDSVEDSKAIDAEDEPSIIISASGMCEAGRILHHLKATVEDPKNTVLIVGYQAQHTLGRRLVEQRTRVRIFGVERERRAEVVGAERLQRPRRPEGPGQLRGRAPPSAARSAQVALVHGDPKPQEILAGLLAAKGAPGAVVRAGDRRPPRRSGERLTGRPCPAGMRGTSRCTKTTTSSASGRSSGTSGRWCGSSGSGGMAAVYVGVHRIGRRDALKILHAEAAKSKEVCLRFEREAQAVNRFRHPGAVEIRDIDVTEDGAPFLVMELLDGRVARRPHAARRQAPRRGGAEPRRAGARLPRRRARAGASSTATSSRPTSSSPREGRLKVLDFGLARMHEVSLTTASSPRRARPWGRRRTCRRSRRAAATSTSAPTSSPWARPCSASSPAGTSTRPAAPSTS